MYIRSLDGIRAVAVLLVMLFHFFFVLEVGWIGVQIFFVLSGFLITSILLRSKTQSFKAYVKRFYWRRSLRIFPLYYLYLLAVTAIFILARTPENFLDKAPFLFTYTFNYFPLFYEYDYDAFFTHLWSLSVEEQFYIVWPFVIFFLSLRQLRWAILLILLATPVLRYGFGSFFYTSYQDVHVLGEVVYRLTLSHMDAFAVGAAIPVFNLQERIKHKTIWLSLLTTLLLVAGGVQLYLALGSLESPANLTSLGYPIGGMTNMQHVWSYTLLNLWAGVLILYLAAGQNGQRASLLVRLLESKPMVLTGQISYGMYVYHWLIFVAHKQFLHERLGNTFLSFLVYFAIVFVVSYLSFNLFEKRLLVWKDQPGLLLKRLRLNRP